MKIRPLGGRFLHEGRWTDRHHEAKSRFSQFFECT